jgi:hypothetical protein
MNDSLPIVLHLEKTVPALEYPNIFSSSGSYELALAVQKIITDIINKRAMIVIPKVAEILDPREAEFFLSDKGGKVRKAVKKNLRRRGKILEVMWKAIRPELKFFNADIEEEGRGKKRFLKGRKWGMRIF